VPHVTAEVEAEIAVQHKNYARIGTISSLAMD
jgi:hypothetical protein